MSLGPKAPALRVLAVASEVYPLIKTGGLADIAGALPGALAAHGIEVRTLVPGYPAVLAALPRGRVVHTMPLMGGVGRIRSGTAGGLALFVLDAPHLFDRAGKPYNGPDGGDWADNPQRFAALCQAGAAIAQGAVKGWQPDVVHAHDWQAGLVPAYLRYGGARDEGRAHPPVVFTIHNLAFTGWCPGGLLGELGLPPESFGIEGVEFYWGIGPLKAGVRLADVVTTVSPTYAAEITLPENGQGLDGLLRSRAGSLHGITNGIDTGVWDPATDALLPFRYTGAHGRRRGRNKAALQAQAGLDVEPETLVFGVVSRLTTQKGIDLVLETVPTMLELGAQLAVLGAGDAAFESALQDAAARHPGRIGAHIGYDEGLAHLYQAGVDAILMPSRFEPCGLTQLCALHYGAVPVVSRVGGLADTVIDANEAALGAKVANGLQFLPVSADGLAAALRRTAVLWADKEAWGHLQRNGMRADVGWTGPGAAYAKIFRSLGVNF